MNRTVQQCQEITVCLQILSQQKQSLAKDLLEENSLASLVYLLLTKKVFAIEQVQSILASGKANIDQCVCLLEYVEDAILSCTSDASRYEMLSHFICALVEKNMCFIAARLHPDLTREFSTVHQSNFECEGEVYISGSDEFASSIPGDASADASNSYCLPTPCTTPNFSASSYGVNEGLCQQQSSSYLQRPKIEVLVEINNEVYGPGDGESSDEEVYRNCSLPRGLVFMVNYEFKDNLLHPAREGSEVDVHNLTNLFTQMGYIIPAVHRNLTRQKTMEVLREFCRDERHTSLHSCVVIIMSHGKDDSSFYTNDNMYIGTEEVMELFSNRECPALEGKPKLFILQFCRGELKDRGVPSNLALVSQGVGFLVQTDSAKMGRTQQITKRTTFSDMITIYSTVEGYVSYRDPVHGTWLVEVLCNVFMREACQSDIERLCRKISSEMAAYESAKGDKQSCEIRSRCVSKQFFFNPCNLDAATRCDKCVAAGQCDKCVAGGQCDKCVAAGQCDKCVAGGQCDKCVAAGQCDKCVAGGQCDKCVAAGQCDKCVAAGQCGEDCVAVKNVRQLDTDLKSFLTDSREFEIVQQLHGRDSINNDPEDIIDKIVSKLKLEGTESASKDNKTFLTDLTKIDELNYANDIKNRLPLLPNNYCSTIDLHPTSPTSPPFARHSSVTSQDSMSAGSAGLQCHSRESSSTMCTEGFDRGSAGEFPPDSSLSETSDVYSPAPLSGVSSGDGEVFFVVRRHSDVSLSLGAPLTAGTVGGLGIMNELEQHLLDA